MTIPNSCQYSFPVNEVHSQLHSELSRYVDLTVTLIACPNLLEREIMCYTSNVNGVRE